MTKSDLISLKELSNTKALVPLDSIPKPFKEDFDKFFYGKTLFEQNNQLYAYPSDIRSWVNYVFNLYKK